MSANILDFKVRCVTPNCPGYGKILQQLRYSVQQVRGLLDSDHAVTGYCAYGDHQWPVDQQVRQELRVRA